MIEIKKLYLLNELRYNNYFLCKDIKKTKSDGLR
jgi:hypothetical protein